MFVVNNSANLTSKNISSEHCVVDYKNMNDLEKQSGFSKYGAYGAAARRRE